MSFVLLAAAIEAVLLYLLRLGDWKQKVESVIPALLVAGLFYLIFAFLILRRDTVLPRRPWILALAVPLLFRATLWPLFPSLSDDIFRYRWEGKIQQMGANPYLVRPADDSWAAARDETFPSVVGKNFRAVYGPLLELIERATYAAVKHFEPAPAGQVFWFKLPAVLADIGVILALMALLRARELPVERAALYSWSPLPLVEFWATGHNDAILLLLLVGAFWCAARLRWWPALLLLGGATAAKLWPALLAPAFLRGGKSLRWGPALGAGLVCAACAAPFAADVTENIRFVTGFLSGWRNNDSLFGILAWITGDQYIAKKTSLALLGLISVGIAALRLPLERGAALLIAGMLLLSANCHPWYLTWLLPFLAFLPSPALLLWTVLVPLAHAPVTGWVLLGEWEGSTPLRWLEYAPVLTLLSAEAARALLRRARV